MERAVLPILAEAEFGLASHTAILSFIATFGIAKAFANLAAGSLGDRDGRKAVLVTGWMVGIPVPFILMWAPAWEWVVFANVLLGLNQGLTWSSTVVMKIDLVGPRRRGFAVGLNEAAGYIAVSLAALASGYVAGRYGLRPEPFYIGIVASIAGLALSLATRDTRGHVALETAGEPNPREISLGEAFRRASWKDRRLFGLSQAGLVNNMGDGIAWGLLPLHFSALDLSIERVAALAALYPAVWGIGQLGTGALSDRAGRRPLIVAGMLAQALGFVVIITGSRFAVLAGAMALLGAGKALVYPTLLAGVGDFAPASWRSSAMGVYRFWRDAGYAVGALMVGGLADAFGLHWSIWATVALTLSSALVVWFHLRDPLRAPTQRMSF